MNKKNDKFADIATMSQDYSGRGLVKPPVMPIAEVDLALDRDGTLADLCAKKMDTKEELYAEVERQKAYYAPFMQKLAPVSDSQRIRDYIFDFRFRKETDSEWVDIKIPHYDGPVGKHTTYYEATFTVTPEMMAKESLFICFDGADYIANVMINDIFVGRHEGFFAPFDFEFKKFAKEGENKLSVRLENDVAMSGDKIYAATGPGFDEPEVGWHHCPAGMGIFQKVYVEARNNAYLQNMYVRVLPDLKNMELWAEVVSMVQGDREITFTYSVNGQNFEASVIKDEKYHPTTDRAIGVGDSLNEALTRKDNLIGVPVVLTLRAGRNFFKIPFSMEDAKLWELDTPYLYQAEVKVEVDGELKDTKAVEFGVRSFSMDNETKPRGKMYFNNRQIRLRGANTMGHEQQDVMKGDFDQLVTDILLAKIANMNFFRLTQRPVQDEIYAYCDMLGMMTQTDLPLFGNLRINLFCEALRQVEEMETLVRPHPCNVVISYINEPFPNSSNAPHRNLSRKDLNTFFDCADSIVLMKNPERVIKHVDGDYDPPSRRLPDNHCYTMWYNGNGVPIGDLNKGEWMPISPDWCFGCGEFGAEGIDSPEVMKKYYPKHWVNTDGRESEWTPTEVTGAQTGKFHYFFFETPKSMEEWSFKSRRHQAESVKWQTECYRQNPLMVTYAIHLFIDAFPSNWMKTIMDVERTPKPAYFTYRNACKPVNVMIRSDYRKIFGGETILFEPIVGNDKDETLKGYTLAYGVDELGKCGDMTVNIDACTPQSMGKLNVSFPTVTERKMFTVRVVLKDEKGDVVDWATQEIEVFPAVPQKNIAVTAYGEVAKKLVADMGYTLADDAKVIIVSDYDEYVDNKANIDAKVKAGAKLVNMRLPSGDFELCGEQISTKFSAMLPLNFVSRDTGHAYTAGINADDMRYWYSESSRRIVPIMYDSFTDDSFTPILLTGNANDQKEWASALSVAEKKVGEGMLVICQLDIADRVKTNPIARIFVQNMIAD